MKVIVSLAPGSRVYHRLGCYYADRISPYYAQIFNQSTAEKRGLCACKYCGGSVGYARVNRKTLKAATLSVKMESWYWDVTDTYYLKTDIGFWKFFWKESAGGYLLYHLSEFNAAKPLEELIHGGFHRQGDLPATTSMEKIINYVDAHDKAKKIIADDYRKLPQKTKKQKQYYKNAARKARRQSYSRMDTLFSLIAQNADNRVLLSHACQA